MWKLLLAIFFFFLIIKFLSFNNKSFCFIDIISELFITREFEAFLSQLFLFKQMLLFFSNTFLLKELLLFVVILIIGFL